VLSQPNYKVIKYVQGESVAKYFLGIGGYGNKGMIAQARQNMLRHAGLIGKSRAVINETVEIRTKQLLLYTEFRYIVSAYIVEFNDDPSLIVAEENNTATQYYEEEKEKTVFKQGATVGLSISGDDTSFNHPRPGFNLGYSAMFSKPKTNGNLFLENQVNFTYLNTRNIYSGSEYNLHSYAIDFPLYAGVNVPMTDNYSMFFKAGPGLGILYYDQNYDNPTLNGYSGFYPKLSLGGFTGFNLGNFRAAIGLEWMIADFAEFSSFKLAFTYTFR
jgi:hypothetical protein